MIVTVLLHEDAHLSQCPPHEDSRITKISALLGGSEEITFPISFIVAPPYMSLIVLVYQLRMLYTNFLKKIARMYKYNQVARHIELQFQ